MIKIKDTQLRRRTKQVKVENIAHYLSEVLNWGAETTELNNSIPELVFRGESKKYQDTECLSRLGRFSKQKLNDDSQNNDLIIGWEQINLRAWVEMSQEADEAIYPDDKWLQLMWARHHGMFCRLSDWSTNPLVALYFSVSNTEHDSESGFIYICRALVFNRCSIESEPFLTKDQEYVINQLYSGPVIGKGHHIFIRPPKTFHSRILKQSGIFHSCSDIRASAIDAQWPKLIIEIPQDAKARIKDQLKLCNITESTLGLITPDKAADYCNQSLQHSFPESFDQK